VGRPGGNFEPAPERGRRCFADAPQQRKFDMAETKKATLYRMVLPDHTCPFGVRAKEMLEQAGYTVEDHILATRGEVDAFKDEHGVATTPQVFIQGERIGGSDDLERYLAQ
jgi:glutaredoxin